MEIDFSQHIPLYVQEIAKTMQKHGYLTYLAGGAVRDILMGKIPNDFDLTTDAKPEDISKIFPKSVSTNARFGTVMVLAHNRDNEPTDVEVTTFRSEAGYVDGRWPSKVEFTTDLNKDLGRRDFTIDAMAINLQALDDGIFTNDLIDLFQGQKHIKERIVKSIGNPYERLQEDGLRSFRACRLASQLGFKIDLETLDAIKKTLDIARNISIERIRDEFIKLLVYSPIPSIGLNLLRDTGLLGIFLPELLDCVGVNQPKKYHIHDVYNHLLAAVDNSEDSVKVAALLHDIGKPRTAKDGHFYRHDLVSASMAENILKRLKFPKDEVLRIARIIRWHMFAYADWRGGKFTSNWKDSAVRRFIKNVGEDYIDDLFRLRIADAICNPKTEFDPREIEAFGLRIADIRQQDVALNIKDLKINGDDLLIIGFPKGPKIGETLNLLLEKVIDDPKLNTKDDLIRLAKTHI